MDINEIKKLIAKDESNVLELKRTTSELVKGMQSLCAFLNSEGGWLFFGITPKLELLGQNVLDTNLDTNLDTSLDTNTVEDSRKTEGLSDKHKEVLAYCVVARSSREILDHIGVTNHSKNRERFVNLLVDKRLLERTIPDSPNSPRQKYVTKK